MGRCRQRMKGKEKQPDYISNRKTLEVPLQSTEIISSNTNKVNEPAMVDARLPVSGALGTGLQIADNLAETRLSQEKRIKKWLRSGLEKRAHDDHPSNNTDENPLESADLCCPDVTNRKQLEIEISCSEMLTDFTTHKKDQEVPLSDTLTSVVSRSSCNNVNISSANERDLLTETQKTSVDVQNLKTYHRKAKRLSCPWGNDLETGKHEGPSASLQVVHNSLMGEVSVDCGKSALTSVEKTPDVKDEGKLNLVRGVVTESNGLEEKRLEVSPTLQNVNEVGNVSSGVVHKRSFEDVPVTCADSELAPRKRKRIESPQEDSSVKDTSRCCTCYDLLIKEYECELNKVHNIAQKLGFSAEKVMEDFAAVVRVAAGRPCEEIGDGSVCSPKKVQHPKECDHHNYEDLERCCGVGGKRVRENFERSLNEYDSLQRSGSNVDAILQGILNKDEGSCISPERAPGTVRELLIPDLNELPADFVPDGYAGDKIIR